MSLKKNYIRERHRFPSIPEQDCYLEPYSDDTPENIRTVNKLYNLVTNFNGSDLFDNDSSLPTTYGVANLHYTAQKQFYTSVADNVLSVGPGVALMGDVLVDVTGTTLITLTDTSSWVPPNGLTLTSYQDWPPNVDYTGAELDIVLSLFRFEDSTDQNAYMMVTTPYAFYTSPQFVSQALPLRHLRLTLDVSGNVTDYENFYDAHHDTGNPAVVDQDNKAIKYISFPYFKRNRLDGGFPNNHY